MYVMWAFPFVRSPGDFIISRDSLAEDTSPFKPYIIQRIVIKFSQCSGTCRKRIDDIFFF